MSFDEILKRKRDYYGYTEAAISFASEEYITESFKLKIMEKYFVIYSTFDGTEVFETDKKDECIKFTLKKYQEFQRKENGADCPRVFLGAELQINVTEMATQIDLE